jgi:hypothetical protein
VGEKRRDGGLSADVVAIAALHYNTVSSANAHLQGQFIKWQVVGLVLLLLEGVSIVQLFRQRL